MGDFKVRRLGEYKVEVTWLRFHVDRPRLLIADAFRIEHGLGRRLVKGTQNECIEALLNSHQQNFPTINNKYAKGSARRTCVVGPLFSVTILVRAVISTNERGRNDSGERTR